MNVDPQSSASASTSSSSISALQRGKACLSCRRRKMKCDGLRPVCTPCLRGERAEDCEYTDGQRRARTLALEEDVARLQARVQELENPEAAMPSVELFTPYATAGPSTMRSASQAQSHARTPAAYHYGGSMSQAPSHGSPSGSVPDPLRLDPEVAVHASRALSVVAPYATELGFFLDIARLRVQGTYVLPALQTVLTLWSVHITSSCEPDRERTVERTRALTSKLLAQVQTQLASALTTVDVEPDPAILLHVVQTGVLLAYYMQRIGQVVGARYYASGTWALTIMSKLHRSPYLAADAGEGGDQTMRGDGTREGPTQGSSIACPFAFAGCARLAPALDEMEAEERVRAFWAVYALDRYFSAVGQVPSQSLSTDGNTMTVPWPDVGSMDEARNVIQDLLDDPSHNFTQDGPSAMHAKASVLLGEARVLAGSYAANNAICQTPSFQARFGILDTLLQRCLNAAIMMASECQPHTAEQKQALVAIHLIALAYVTHHRPFILTYCPSARRCVDATFGVVRLLDRMRELGTSVGCVSPLYAIVWTALCLAMHDEVLSLRARPGADPSRHREAEVVGAIRKLVDRLSALSQGCPNEFFAIKIEAVLPILESIVV